MYKKCQILANTLVTTSIFNFAHVSHLELSIVWRPEGFFSKCHFGMEPSKKAWEKTDMRRQVRTEWLKHIYNCFSISREILKYIYHLQKKINKKLSSHISYFGKSEVGTSQTNSVSNKFLSRHFPFLINTSDSCFKYLWRLKA